MFQLSSVGTIQMLGSREPGGILGLVLTLEQLRSRVRRMDPDRARSKAGIHACVELIHGVEIRSSPVDVAEEVNRWMYSKRNGYETFEHSECTFQCPDI